MLIDVVLTSFDDGTNTYIVTNDGRGFVVDPGSKAQEICNRLEMHGASLDAILCTHVHFDHIGAVAQLLQLAKQKGLSNAEHPTAVFMHKDDIDGIKSNKNLGYQFGMPVQPFDVDVALVGGETLNIAGLQVSVIHTPGHTEGGVCYLVGDVMFSGDTLFCGSYGNPNFVGGDFATLKNSIVNKLFRLEKDYKVLAGHNGPTTLFVEKVLNPILCK